MQTLRTVGKSPITHFWIRFPKTWRATNGNYVAYFSNSIQRLFKKSLGLSYR